MVLGLATVSALAATVVYAPAVSAPAVQPGVPPLCRVVEAAYAAATESKDSAYPATITPSFRGLRLAEMTQDYRRRLPLTAAELDALAARQDASGGAGFRPVCVPTVPPTPARDEQGHEMAVSFTEPAISASGTLAIVEVSFREGSFGYGKICVVRAAEGRWRAQCIPSWIT